MGGALGLKEKAEKLIAGARSAELNACYQLRRAVVRQLYSADISPHHQDWEANIINRVVIPIRGSMSGADSILDSCLEIYYEMVSLERLSKWINTNKPVQSASVARVWGKAVGITNITRDIPRVYLRMINNYVIPPPLDSIVDTDGYDYMEEIGDWV